MVDRARRIAELADWLFVALAVGCGVTLLYLGRSLTFEDDEWRSITFDGGVLDYIRPVNQHWSTIPLLMYRGTFHVVGLHSYIPYLAEGGVTTGPTLAMIGEGREQEAVLPLSKLQGLLNMQGGQPPIILQINGGGFREFLQENVRVTSGGDIVKYAGGD